MIDVILVFDDLNPRGGAFLTECKDEIVSFFAGKEYNLEIISTPDISAKRIYDSTLNLSSFIFVPYCHGNETCLANAIPEIFISSTENISNFSNTFFYTFSCSSGHTLGGELIDKGCHCFFGYNKQIWSISGYKQFSQCANYGLYLFIDGMATEDIYFEMIRFYNDKIDEISKIDFMVASHLRLNRDALVRRGNNITIKDLVV